MRAQRLDIQKHTLRSALRLESKKMLDTDVNIPLVVLIAYLPPVSRCLPVKSTG